MLDRRSVLRRAGGALTTATLASSAGCFFTVGSSSSSASSTFLTPLPNPLPGVAPNFHCAYGYDPAAIQRTLGGTDAMPSLAGQFVTVVDQLRGTAVEDVDRLSGQTVRQVGHPGSDLGVVASDGTDLVAEGSIDVDGAVDWLATREQLENLGRSRGYRRFGNGGATVEGFAVDEDAMTFGNRRATSLSAADVTAAAIEGLQSDAAAAAETTPTLAATVDELPSGSATIATAFDLVAERPDTGSEAYDGTASSLLAAGLSANVGDETTAITRVLRYRRGRVASVDSVRAAVDEAVAAGYLTDVEWTVSASGRSVRIEGSVSTATLADAPELLRRGVPVPAYDGLPTPVDPRELGRDAPPRVAWELSMLDDGRVAVVHGGGPDVEGITVAYTVDGERVREDWQGPVSSEDRFETSEAPDAGSVVDVVWARGTANETILIRAELS
ncbi:hypothetical protein L593_03070 [Salinarchaeum sp. Harcht-Bsk1]|uniref:hypothetical protein n=1 Tax=Salinarchaeum sp. Harcht-Bsk1 TaxID=1333523 RepID=UPI00034237D1|nr:hypothetical protein [Salinarchaeum sp. Harcht-Bsk1]AGN00565.1 hypothetical protein L593_03070 [Salinarchaeum sp. Harcht-Bsk1]